MTSHTTRTVTGRSTPLFVERLRACFDQDLVDEVEQRQARDDVLMTAADMVDTAAALALLDVAFARLDRDHR